MAGIGVDFVASTSVGDDGFAHLDQSPTLGRSITMGYPILLFMTCFNTQKHELALTSNMLKLESSSLQYSLIVCFVLHTSPSNLGRIFRCTRAGLRHCEQRCMR